ncbi:hypothetical protein [Streptomyces sp. NPDC008122]
MAGDVPDHEEETAVGELDGAVPVSTDVQTLVGGLVDDADQQIGRVQ